MPQKTHILLVEDNPADVALVSRALREYEFKGTIDVAEDGEQALRYLRGEGEFATRRRPHLVLLDLNLPKLDGFEVLAEMRSDPELRAIPVLVLSTSSSEHDVVKAYARAANAYMVKPENLADYELLARSVDQFWFRQAMLPGGFSETGSYHLDGL